MDFMYPLYFCRNVMSRVFGKFIYICLIFLPILQKNASITRLFVG